LERSTFRVRGKVTDIFPADSLLVIVESHVTIPQIGTMFKGNWPPKESLAIF